MSKIEWTDETWNPIVGCSIVSPGCTNCYAMKFAGTRLGHVAKYDGLTKPSKAGPVWTGKLAFGEKALLAPLGWKKPRTVFVNSMGDLFHEDCPDEWIDRVFAVMALCPQHTFQVLTKRSGRMREYFEAKTEINPPMNGNDTYPRAHGHVEQWANLIGMNNSRDLPWRPRHESGGYWWGFKADMPWPLQNVWLGVSVEDQTRADERIPDLLATPAAIRWISAEPLLGPISLHPKANAVYQRLSKWYGPDGFDETGAQPVQDRMRGYFPKLDWVVVGGESGKGARPMHPDWARSLRDQCAAADVPFFFKQWGEWKPHTPKAGGDLGGDVRSGKVKIVHPTGRSMVEVFEASGRNTEQGSRYMIRVGKAKAGRMLDGETHDGFPRGIGRLSA